MVTEMDGVLETMNIHLEEELYYCYCCIFPFLLLQLSPSLSCFRCLNQNYL